MGHRRGDGDDSYSYSYSVDLESEANFNLVTSHPSTYACGHTALQLVRTDIQTYTYDRRNVLQRQHKQASNSAPSPLLSTILIFTFKPTPVPPS